MLPFPSIRSTTRGTVVAIPPPTLPSPTPPYLSVSAMAPYLAVFLAAAAAVAATTAAGSASADWVSTAAGVGALFRGGNGRPILDLVAPRVVPSAGAAAASSAASSAAATATTTTTTTATATTPNVLLSAAVEQPATEPALATAVVAATRRSTPAWWTARQLVGGRRVSAAPRSLYVNVGGGFVNFEGHTWVSDADPLGGGAPSDTRVFGKTNTSGLPALLSTNRYAQGISMAFTRTVTGASSYRLELLWAEIFVTEANIRLMDIFVSVDGQQPVEVASRLDVFGTVGADTPLRLAYPPVGSPAMPIESTVTITLQRSDFGAPGVSNVFLSAFSLVEEPSLTPTPVPTTTPSPADPKRIGSILASATAAADKAIPAARAAARLTALTNETVAVAAADRRAVTPLYNAAPRTPELSAAWTAYGTATTTFEDEVRVFKEAMPAIAARRRMVTAALIATRDYAAGLMPPVCAFLQNGASAGGSGGSTPVTPAEIQALDGFAAGVRTEVAALHDAVKVANTRYEAVAAAAEALRASLSNLRVALPLAVV